MSSLPFAIYGSVLTLGAFLVKKYLSPAVGASLVQSKFDEKVYNFHFTPFFLFHMVSGLSHQKIFLTQDRPKVGVSAFIFDSVHKRLLIGQRKSSHGVNKWCNPGGHLEMGESFEVRAVCSNETLHFYFFISA